MNQVEVGDSELDSELVRSKQQNTFLGSAFVEHSMHVWFPLMNSADMAPATTCPSCVAPAAPAASKKIWHGASTDSVTCAFAETNFCLIRSSVRVFVVFA